MIRGHLEILVLKLISKEPLSGYMLMKKIKELMGYKPSSGSIYPLLEQLNKKSLVAIKRSGRKKIYSITKKGKEKIKLIYDKHDEIVDKINESIVLLDNVFGEKKFAFVKAIKEEMQSGQMPFQHLEPELSELKSTIMHYAILKKDINKEKVKKILKRTAKQIRSLS
ncbi:MAG: PadR family transcriptional regulator [archaeon]